MTAVFDLMWLLWICQVWSLYIIWKMPFRSKQMPVSKKSLVSAERDARVRELQQKVYDQVYMEAAIQRIALVLSRKLVENNNILRLQ